MTCHDGAKYGIVGNGYCNDETNNADCNYDGGDCCKTHVNSDHCSECICYHQETCAAGVNPRMTNVWSIRPTHEWVSNGYCNDETNNADCNYDGGDCCLSSPKTDNCSECVCSTTGVITSPGYPIYYPNNLEVSWLIQVPSGQRIEIIFKSFIVQYHSRCR